MKIKTGFVTQPIGDKTIVVSTGKLCKTFHGMIELNITGTDIWNWLSEGLEAKEIAEKLADKYGITIEKARNDVSKLIKKMEEYGIFEK